MSLLCSLPNELCYLILSFIPDLLTLSCLLTAYPFLSPLFVHRYRVLFAEILANTTPRQFAKLASAVLLLQPHRPKWKPTTTLADSKRNLCAHLKHGTNNCGIPEMENPLAVLENMVLVYQDIDSWTDAFVQSRCRIPRMKDAKIAAPPTTTIAAAAATEEPLSPTELYRIRRALWRLWVLCKLSHFSLGLTRQRSCDVEAVHRDFLDDLTAWELEELECVYFFLRDAYRASVRGDSGQEKGETRVHDQAPIIQRLLVLMGYEIDAPSPKTLDEWPNPSHPHRDRFFYSQISAHARRTYDLPASPPTAWPDTPTGANAPNEGWLCYCRNSVVGPDNYYGMFNGLAPPCEDKGRGAMKGFQRWGYCVWDEGRLRGWDMLEGWRGGRWRVPKGRWFHGGDDELEEEKEREKEEKRKEKEKKNEKEREKVSGPKPRSPWWKVEDDDFIEKKLTISPDGEVVTDDEGELSTASPAIVHWSYR